MPNNYAKSRCDCLWKAYKDALARPDIRTHNDAIAAAIKSKSPRFWISTKEAAREIARMKKGRKTTYKDGNMKKEIINEVYKRYQRLENGFMKGSSIYLITSFAVLSEAPQFYISFARARKIINLMRKRARNGAADR